MKLTRFEKLTLIWCLVLLACSVALFWADAVHAAPVKRYHPPGPFTLVLKYSHHTYLGGTTHITPRYELNEEWVDVVDRVELVGPIYGWDVCAGAALEAQAKQQDPAHDAYVTPSCLYLGRR